MKPVIQLDRHHEVVGTSDVTGSGMSSSVSWSKLAEVLRAAGVGHLRANEHFGQLELTEQGITLRIVEK